MKKNEFNSAIVGCGIISPSHYKSIKELGFSKLISLIDTDKSILNKKAKFWKINKFSDDIDYLTEIVKPEIAHICTPPQYHYDLISKLATAGINLFVEKPFVLSLDELNKVKEIKSKGKIYCNHNYTYKKSILKLKSFLKLNDLVPKQIMAYYSINTDKGNYSEKNSVRHWSFGIPSGPVINNISHPLSIISLFGGRFKNISATQSIIDNSDSWSIDIQSKTTHSLCKIFMTDKYMDKSVTFIFDNFKIHCDLHRDVIYFYPLGKGVVNDFFLASLKSSFYGFRDLLSGFPRIYQSITRKMPDITKSLDNFYSHIRAETSDHQNLSQIEDSVKVIDSIIKKSNYK